MPKLATRSLLVSALLAIFAISLTTGSASAYQAATSGSATVLLGDQLLGLHRNHLYAERAEAFPLRARTSGVTGAVHMYIDSGSTARAVAVGIYSDAGNRPGSLLSGGFELSPRVSSWITVPVAPTQLASGRTYWLAVLGEGGTLRYRVRRGGLCSSSLSVQTDLRELPKRWSAGGVRARTHCPISAYVAAAGPTVSLNPPASEPVASPAQPPSGAASRTEGTPSSPSGESSPSSEKALSPAEEHPAEEHPSEEPLPPPPAPRNITLPVIGGSTIVGEKLSASAGTWAGSPTSYAYRWEDCTALGVGCLSVKGATSSSYKLTASDVESTLRVVVTASNTGGATPATSEQTAVVVSEPPAAPTNIEPPEISGTAEEGRTLSTSNGAWTGDPTSYAYQWEDCNPSGSGCSAIGGATASTQVLTSSDVGHTVRVVVKATNGGGTGEAISSVTSVVATEETIKGGTPIHCFENPEFEGTERIEACGYPGAHNVGYEVGGKQCSELTPSGSMTTKIDGEQIEGKDITGSVVIENDNVTMNDDCISTHSKSGSGGQAIRLECGKAQDFSIENSDVHGSANVENKEGTEGPVNSAIENGCVSGLEGGQTGVARKDAMWNCSSCILGNVELDDSYVLANAGQKTGNKEDWHNEDIYINSSAGYGGLATDNGDTLLNPGAETAIVFGDTETGAGGEACSDKVNLTNSFLAGSGYMLNICSGGRATGKGTGEIIVRNDRFARCVKGIEETAYGSRCRPPKAWEELEPEAYVYGEEYGYFPEGGANAPGAILECSPACPTGAAFAWEGNYWDNNLDKVAE